MTVGTFAGVNVLPGMPGTFTRGFREQPIRRIGTVRGPLTDQTLEHYEMGDLTILVAREPAGKNGELLWHLSISHPLRHPTWDEIKVARYRLLPHDLAFSIILPPPEFYVNVEAQDHVFHLWETTDPREPWSGR